MRAAIYTKYGSPSNLTLTDVRKPTPGDNEVLVKVSAVSINDWDWQLLMGIPLANRLSNGIERPKKRQILGCDVAGVIEATGKNAARFVPGDPVYGDLCMSGFGGFAEYVSAPESSLSLKPKAMTFEQAASIPQASMLALQGLGVKGPLQRGQKLLINGAGGGVGTFGVQMAKMKGVDVTGVDHTTKLDMMRSVGFDHVVDYLKEDFANNGKQYDYILDTKTNRPLRCYLRALRPHGVYATIGGETLRLMQVLFAQRIFSKLSNKAIRLVILKPNKDLSHMNDLFNSGKIRPVIDKTFQLEELPDAMLYFGLGKHKGKVVIQVDSSKKT
jgi:NADPH:quinone reductase-like Zn-dependent oxidoreductase